MRLLPLLASLCLLAACQPAEKPHPEVGSDAWFEWATNAAGVTDGQGHGPDYGSQEWCNAVSFKIYDERPVVDVTCDEVWLREVDSKLRERR